MIITLGIILFWIAYFIGICYIWSYKGNKDPIKNK